MVKLDGWIQLKMYPEQAASVVALRYAVESILVAAATDPSCLAGPGTGDGEESEKFPEKLRLLQQTLMWTCSFSSGRRELPKVDLAEMSRCVSGGISTENRSIV